MRLLLDECVDEKPRHFFDGRICYSARYAGTAGLKNGALLLAAEDADFEVIITTDQEIPHQQYLGLRRISIVILRGPTNRLADLKRLVPAVQRALCTILPDQVVTVGTGD